MVKPKKSNIAGGFSDQSIKSLGKDGQRAQKVSKVVKDVENAESFSNFVSTKRSQASLGTRSPSIPSDEFFPSPTPSAVSPQLKAKKSKSFIRLKVSKSLTSIASRKHTSSALTNRSSDGSDQPWQIYKIIKKESSEKVQFEQSKSFEISSSSESEFVDEEGFAPGENDSSFHTELSSLFKSDGRMSASSDSNIRMRFNLLDGIRNLPDLDEISARSSSEHDLKRSESDMDLGKFRNPLTYSSSLTYTDGTLATDQYDEAMDDTMFPMSDESDAQGLAMISSSELESDDDIDWGSENKQDKSSIVPEFADITIGSVESIPKRVRQTVCVDSICENVLTEIVDQVVENLENEDLVRRKNLDKGKLLDRLREEVDDHFWEKYENDFLTKRMTEYYLRRFKYSLITPSTTSELNDAYRGRYMSALYELDRWMLKEREAEELLLAERDRLNTEFEQKKSEETEQFERLEKLFRNTIYGRAAPSDRLQNVTEGLLRQMRKKRDAISETRTVLIVKQHNYAYIKKKINNTDTLSGEVKIDTYLSTEQGVQDLANTLHNRNEELNRMYTLVKNKIHTISHMRCRRKLLGQKFRVAKVELLERRGQLLALRDRVHESNVLHNKLRAKIQQARFKSGLKSYPKLLADFDQTKKLVLMKRNDVKQLKKQQDNLIKKVDKIELEIQESCFSIQSKGTPKKKRMQYRNK
ncbi:uncharacterized protein LOC108098709 [Drosophila ficusphila]|uniref:uncharacterized protein LOC108098709 n=1 Tax=Drosophila ficusphila TaxID=30025 RepID=UPI001C8AC074|nr:uncharacterized protein LOC108098709 [Drosophila ficusphila]